MPEDLSDFWTIESMGVAVEKPQLPLDQHWTLKCINKKTTEWVKCDHICREMCFEYVFEY